MKDKGYFGGGTELGKHISIKQYRQILEPRLLHFHPVFRKILVEK